MFDDENSNHFELDLAQVCMILDRSTYFIFHYINLIDNHLHKDKTPENTDQVTETGEGEEGNKENTDNTDKEDSNTNPQETGEEGMPFPIQCISISKLSKCMNLVFWFR